MTLLGFNIGSAPASAEPVDMSLDEMIASRRRQASQAKKPQKSVSNVDRSIATSRAKRDAAMAAKRGLSSSAKPTQMEIEKEVTKQAAKSVAKNSRSHTPKATAGTRDTGAARAEKRRQNRSAKRTAAAAAATVGPAKGKRNKSLEGVPNLASVVSLARPPPKSAIRAAVNAMEETGFQIPEGMQMVISFAPAPASSSRPKQPPSKSQTASGGGTTGATRDGRRGGGRGRGRGPANT